MGRALGILSILATAAAAHAATTDIDAFLRAVEQAAQTPTAVRADGELVNRAPDKTEKNQIALVQRENNDLYVELRQPPLRGLILGGGAQAYILPAGKKEAESWPAKDPLDASDFTREDLQPFVLAHYQTPRIVDESAEQITVALFPKQSQYIMVVFTFDREKKIALKAMYYQETLSNLVKMRRDSDHVLVGQHWLPTTVTMETFALRTQSALQLRWTQAPPITPEMFQPAFLARPSTITWLPVTETPR